MLYFSKRVGIFVQVSEYYDTRSDNLTLGSQYTELEMCQLTF